MYRLGNILGGQMRLLPWTFHKRTTVTDERMDDDDGWGQHDKTEESRGLKDKATQDI